MYFMVYVGLGWIMIRVSPEFPCPVCGKEDWCLLAPDGKVAICQRTEEGAIKRCGSAGWLHATNGPYIGKLKERKRKVVSPINWNKLQILYTKQYQHCRSELQFEYAKLLEEFWVGYCEPYLTIPMWHGKEIIGIQRVHTETRAKAFMKGSRQGLFKPGIQHSSMNGELFVTEGVGDTATASRLGLRCVGVPSAGTCSDLVLEEAIANNHKYVVVIADDDMPGRTGARLLCECLEKERIPGIIMIPPYKDLREWSENSSLDEIKQKITDYVNDMVYRWTNTG